MRTKPAHKISLNEPNLSKDVLFTASDPKYFNRFAAPLVVSAVDNQMPLYLGLCNPDGRSYATLGFIADYVRETGSDHLVKWGVEECDLHPKVDKGVWAGCARMRHALMYWQNPEHTNDKLFLLDMDSLVRKEFSFPSAKVSLCIDPLRDEWGEPIRYGKDKWNTDCSRILMSGFYSSEASSVLEHALSICEKMKYKRWGMDQLALWKTLNEPEFLSWWPSIYNYFGTKILQWSDWDEKGLVWTGKWNKLQLENPYRTAAREAYKRFLKIVAPMNPELNVPGLFTLFED